jgi:hypothetical protein
MTKRGIGTMLAYGALLGMAAQAQEAGRISGVVIDHAGAPVAGSTVLYRSGPRAARGADGRMVALLPLVRSGLSTAADGAFAIPDLPDGQYYLCAYGALPTQLSTCEWGRFQAPLQITGGSAIRNVTLQLSEGSLLNFQVSDPNGVIVDRASGPVMDGRLPLSGGNFRIGVMMGGYYGRAEFVSQGGANRTYEVAVPKGVTVALFADTELRVSTQIGAPVPAEELSIVIPTADAAGQTIHLQVE